MLLICSRMAPKEETKVSGGAQNDAPEPFLMATLIQGWETDYRLCVKRQWSQIFDSAGTGKVTLVEKKTC